MDPLFRRAGPIIALKRPSLSIEPQVHVRKLKHELEPHARKLGFYPTAEGVPEGDRAAENASRSRFDSQEAQIAEEPCEVLRFFLGPHGCHLIDFLYFCTFCSRSCSIYAFAILFKFSQLHESGTFQFSCCF
uniref:Uncharacterized protein n=1 Tax=Triticum urartu TaxID=4572 RepID=A0A8R7P8D5_TRIUA